VVDGADLNERNGPEFGCVGDDDPASGAAHGGPLGLGVVELVLGDPLGGVAPPTVRITVSKASCSKVEMVIPPTKDRSWGLTTPPGIIRVTLGMPARTSATRKLRAIARTRMSAGSASATCIVVVPASMMRVSPSRMRAAARWPMRCLASAWRRLRAANPGSKLREIVEVAPP
jgi:hypothetical protein